MKTAKERLERFRKDTGIRLLSDGAAARLIEEHEAEVVEAIAAYIERNASDYFRTPTAAHVVIDRIRSGAWRKKGA